MKVKELSVAEIKLGDNVRLRSGKSSVADLMRDIKQNGLLHPIGVAKEGRGYTIMYGYRRLEAIKKLGWKTIPCVVNDEACMEDMYISNMTENIHREDVTPFELGRMCATFIKQFDSNLSEVSAMLSLPKNKVADSIRAYKVLPEDLAGEIVFAGKGNKKEGKVPISVVSSILSNQILNSEAKVELVKVAKEREITSNDMAIVGTLVKDGTPIKKAIKKLDTLSATTSRIIFDRKKYVKLREVYSDLAISDIVRKALLREIDISDYIR